MSDQALESSSIKILLVDDRNENLVAMKKTLAPLKLEVITALSGNEALKLMLVHDFAVALLDVMMPDINGFEVAELMHQNDSTRHIPIIFITAINKSDQNYIQGMEAGAIDFLYKPIDPLILLSKVRVFVDLYTVRNKLEKTIARMDDIQSLLHENNIKLKQLAEEDILTKISNRRYFESEIERLMELAKRDGKLIALLFLDVDDFKAINDNNGHRAGDMVLKILAERIKKVEFNPEIVAAGLHLDLIARLGGDEFAVVVGGVLDKPSNAEIVAQQILKVMEDPFECDGDNIKVSISIGIANFPPSGTTLTELMHASDTSLYKAKAAGKNTYAMHDPGLESSPQARE